MDETKKKDEDNNVNAVSKLQSPTCCINKEDNDYEKNDSRKDVAAIIVITKTSSISEHEDENDEDESTVTEAPPLMRQRQLSLPGAFVVRHPDAPGENDDEEQGGNT